MPSAYTNFETSHSSGTCGECYQGLRDTDAVAHSGNGQNHPLHRACAKAAATISNLCPTGCGTEIDANSLYTLKERCIKEMKCMGLNAGIGLFFGSFMSMAITYDIDKALFFGQGVASVLAGALLLPKVVTPRQIREVIMVDGSGLAASLRGVFWIRAQEFTVAVATDREEINDEYVAAVTATVKTALAPYLVAAIMAAGVLGSVLGGFIYRRFCKL